MGEINDFCALLAAIVAILPPAKEATGDSMWVMALEGSALTTWAAVLIFEGEAATILALRGNNMVSPDPTMPPILLGVLSNSFVGVPLMPPCWNGIVRIWVPARKIIFWIRPSLHFT